jgi:uncharacterized damage-inducible protein DinB
MSLLKHYRLMYEYEKDCDRKMIAMLESVPATNRDDARFQRAVSLAYHIAAGRENWLDFMDGEGHNQIPWNDPNCELAALPPRFAELESQWTGYFARIDENTLTGEFEFQLPGEGRFRLPIEVQIVQLIGHASYHRGQVALLVDQLGGETVDTDYADWWWFNCKDKQ